MLAFAQSLVKFSIFKWGVLGLLALAALSFHTRWKQSSTKKTIRRACKESKDGIFVALVGEHSTLASAQALFSVFQQASCPYRVRVGLYELIQRESVLDVYKRMAEKNSDSGLSFVENVVCMRRYAENKGPYAALGELMQHSYSGEKYVLTLSSSVQMLKGWDTLLIHLSEKAGPKTALVVSPKLHPSFYVLKNFENGFPEFGAKPMFLPQNAPSKFWTRECSFAPASFWTKFRDLRFLRHGTDALISADAVAAGWKFLSPCKHDIALPIAAGESAWERTLQQENRAQKAFLQLEDSLRVLDLKQAGRLAIMGIVNEQDEDEIRAKYGTRADYKYLAGL
jgi:hypothetical protein